MSIRQVLLTLALLAASADARSPERLRVVTTIPDLADIVSVIGGDRVEVSSIAKGRENVHAVNVKPSHLIALSRADLFVEMGMSLEHAWVPGLLMAARNAHVRPGGDGFVNASVGWTAIEVPETLSRRQGTDIHPEGNPHFNLDPDAGRHLADAVLAGLVRVDPKSESAYRARHAAYVERIDAARERWDAIARRTAGHTVVEYHKTFDYLIRHLGLELVATLEPKPGVPPTPRHLSEVIGAMRERSVEVVLTEAWSNDASVRQVTRATSARGVELPTMVEGAEGAGSWIALMDLLHDRLAEAFGVEAQER